MEWQQFLAIILGAIVSGIVGIFTVLLTGKMRDRQWERGNIFEPLYSRSYEPASILLERIKVEKEKVLGKSQLTSRTKRKA